MTLELKERNLKLRMSTRQFEMLRKKATEHGFSSVCEYIRFNLFLQKPIADKIHCIYEKVCSNEQLS